MHFSYAARVNALPKYLFDELDRAAEAKRKEGVDLIDLSVGDPDLPTPQHIVEAGCEALRDASTHRYPAYWGMRELRGEIAKWYQREFGVELDAEREVMILIGAKEGIAHLPLAFVGEGDAVLYQNPGYPVYHNATIMAGGEPVALPALESNGYMPALDAVDDADRRRAKLMFLNYPNNPTAATADAQYFNKVLEFAETNNIVVAHDLTYSHVAYEGYKAPSLLGIAGAKEQCVEFHSFSKTYSMTGWRLGFVVGNADALAGLARIKTNVDSGCFNAVQRAGIAALTGPQQCVADNVAAYQKRRDALVEGLAAAGIRCNKPKATFYVWAKCPEGASAMQFAKRLLDAGVVCTPGTGFGEHGEGYVRFALVQGEERIREAAGRLKGVVSA